MQSPHLLTITEAIERIRAGTLSARELWKACIRQIELLNPRLDAIITPMDRLEQTGLPTETGPLNAIPLALKDLFETAGVRTTAGALFFRNHVPADDAVVVAKVRAAGAQFVGKSNTHEIALGVTTGQPAFWDLSKSVGHRPYSRRFIRRIRCGRGNRNGNRCARH